VLAVKSHQKNSPPQTLVTNANLILPLHLLKNLLLRLHLRINVLLRSFPSQIRATLLLREVGFVRGEAVTSGGGLVFGGVVGSSFHGGYFLE